MRAPDGGIAFRCATDEEIGELVTRRAVWIGVPE
jgi:hypothetical protein